jgi:DNA-binding NtrC family response regulator
MELHTPRRQPRNRSAERAMQTATYAIRPISIDRDLPLSGETVVKGEHRQRRGESVAPLIDPSHPRLASTSPAMDDVFTMLGRLAATDVTVTLTGETGTGKDVFAHLLHDSSLRAGKPFVVFDCGAVPANLVESELFGHERGSFTGAHAEHVGVFERASGGTVFLDEIGELPMELQPRLLRVLDNRVVRRVGGTKDRQIDLRIIAATNRDLSVLTAAKQFRNDLYFRLAGAIVHLPPLRERLDDLPLLLPQLMRDLGRSDLIISDETVAALREHAWPGNVRELKNTLACAIAFVDGRTLEARHLRLTKATTHLSRLDGLPLGGHSLESIEQIAILQTVKLSGGNKVRAARALGISPSTLYEKLKRYGI